MKILRISNEATKGILDLNLKYIYQTAYTPGQELIFYTPVCREIYTTISNEEVFKPEDIRKIWNMYNELLESTSLKLLVVKINE